MEGRPPLPQRDTPFMYSASSVCKSKKSNRDITKYIKEDRNTFKKL